MGTMKIIHVLCLVTMIGCSTAKISKAQMGMGEQDCEADLMATGQYVLILKEQRDRYEEEIARLRYHVSQLKEKNLTLPQKEGGEK